MNHLKTYKIKNQHFLIFGEDYARHPHALEHILRPLFNENYFIWVETIGLRSPRFSIYDLKRIKEKIFSWIKGNQNNHPKEIPATLTIVSPFMIPFNQYKIIRKFNQWNVVRTIKKQIDQKKAKNLITITSVPNACDYIGHFNELLKLYFCVDEFSLWPGLNYNLVKNLEESLIEKVDSIIATSDNLAKTKFKKNNITPVITHGVEFRHFNLGPKKINTQTTKLCYFGLFDERNDQNLLYELINNIQNTEIHIFGEVVCDCKKLKNIPNIIFHGKVAYKDLPSLISDMDIFLLPYVRNALTENINPLKLKEYLSTARPVIATALPEVVKLKEHLFIGQTSEDFKEIINKIREGKIIYQHESVLTYVQNHETWQAKANRLSGIIVNNLKVNDY